MQRRLKSDYKLQMALLLAVMCQLCGIASVTGTRRQQSDDLALVKINSSSQDPCIAAEPTFGRKPLEYRLRPSLHPAWDRMA